MEITIGIKHVPTPVTVRTDASREDVQAQVEHAMSNGAILQLDDVRGGAVVVDGGSIAYVEIAATASRPVGFGIA
ncbi:MAG: DUF3107 domain-containing protein [Buchananella hordeovulneris]|nr:DUF3107 domain-containing protein [Buchananella hordeovulneris]